jgi:Mn-dependent DtxR family transcriptional regulator
MIGVSERHANEDACEIEHKINYETMTKLAKFVEFVQSASGTPLFLKHFQFYLKTGKKPDECKETSPSSRK